MDNSLEVGKKRECPDALWGNLNYWNKPQGDFPGSPVVKTSPSNAGGVGSIPGQGAKIPHALQPNNQNIKQK